MSAVGKLFNTVLNNMLDSFSVDTNVIRNCQIGFSKIARTADHMFILKTLIAANQGVDCMHILKTFVKPSTLLYMKV